MQLTNAEAAALMDDAAAPHIAINATLTERIAELERERDAAVNQYTFLCDQKANLHVELDAAVARYEAAERELETMTEYGARVQLRNAALVEALKLLKESLEVAVENHECQRGRRGCLYCKDLRAASKLIADTTDAERELAAKVRAR